MKKYTVLVGLLLVACSAFAQPTEYALRNYAVQGPELNGAGYFECPKTMIGRTYVGTAVADTFVVAVDKSSTTLKGSAVNEIDLRQLTAQADVISGTWNVKVGVVVAANATNGTVAWLDAVEWTVAGAKSNVFYFPNGLLSGGTLTDSSDLSNAGVAGAFISNSTLTTTALQTDAGDLKSPESAVVSASTGDVILCFDLTAPAGEINLAGVTANYALH